MSTAIDARWYPRPNMTDVSGGPYAIGHTPWIKVGHMQEHEIPVEASHPGPRLKHSIVLRHSVTGALLQHVGIGASIRYFGVDPR